MYGKFRKTPNVNTHPLPNSDELVDINRFNGNAY